MRPIHTLFIALAMALPTCAYAQISVNDEMQQQMMQQLQSMSPEERKAMVNSLAQNAQAIQSCVEEAGGEETLKDLQAIGEAHRLQVKNLCETNQQEAAKAYAYDAATELKKDPRVEKLRKCSRMALQNMPQLAQMVETGGLDTSKPICN